MLPTINTWRYELTGWLIRIMVRLSHEIDVMRIDSARSAIEPGNRASVDKYVAMQVRYFNRWER